MARTCSLLRGMLLAGAAFGATNAMAQDAPTGATEGVEESMADIVVTARKRAERLIDVPVAITAIDDTQIARYGTSDLSALGQQVPQVQFTKNPSGNGANITIRGVGTNTSADDGVEQAVSINIDGVGTARGRVLQTGLFDVANVQVLKGPQALYFGKNSPGGVIVVETKGPTSSFEGYVRAGYEFQAHEYYGEAAVGGPLSDTLGIRVAVRGSNMQQGYVRNIAQPIAAAANPVAYDRANGFSIPGRAFAWGPNAKQLAGRVTLAWKPTSNFDATLKFLVSDYRDQGDAAMNVIASCAVGRTQVTTTDLSNALLTGTPGIAADPYGVCGGERRVNTIGELPAQIKAGLPFNKNDTEFTNNRNYLGSLTLNYRDDVMAVTSVTGFYKYRNNGTSFYDANTLSLAGGAANADYRSISQELRAQTLFDSPLNVTLGLFYSNDTRDYRSFSSVIRYISPTTGNSVTSSGMQRTEGNTMSAFAEATWKITPTIELAAGGRYTYEQKNGTAYNDYVSGPGAAFNLALPQGRVVSARLRNNDFSPQATLTWHPSPDTTVYAGYRTGFKAGAITNPTLIPANLTSLTAVINPEDVKGIEGGFKFQSADRRLSGDLSVYRYTFKDLQVSAFDSVSNTVRTTNAGGSEIKGIEASLKYRATDQLGLHMAGGYNRARYTAFPNAACWGGQTVAQGCTANRQNLTGEPLPRSPLWSGNAGMTYDVPMGAVDLGFTLDGRYSSSYKFVATNNPFARQDGYVTVDASVRLSDADRRWELALIGRNLTDAFYFTVGSERPFGTSPGSIQGVPGTPRTVALQATYNF